MLAPVAPGSTGRAGWGAACSMPIHATPAILVETGCMRGYHSGSYGDAFADVYDDWYRDIGDIDTTVGFVAGLAGDGGAVLELGVGTGRLAVPLAAAGCRVTGIDASAKMLDRLASNDPHRTVVGVLGDMVDDLPAGPFDVVLAAYNALFNLLDERRQRRCFAEVAARLGTGGAFVVEAFVPRRPSDVAGESDGPSQVTVRSIGTDHVVLSASVHDQPAQRVDGQFIEITESGGIRLRPWAIRYADTDEIDHFATESGLTFDGRWEDFHRAPFDDASERHVTVYRRRQGGVKNAFHPDEFP